MQNQKIQKAFLAMASIGLTAFTPMGTVEVQKEIENNIILGSVSIPIKMTPLDGKWSRIKIGENLNVKNTLRQTREAEFPGKLQKAIAVNSWVNKNIKFAEDSAIYDKSDYWAASAETLKRGTGDCEDLVIAKMDLLSAAGFHSDKMRMVLVRDTVRNADHAVLILMLADRTVMFDNVSNRAFDAKLPNDYRPIMSFSKNGRWIHGYSVN